MRWLKPNLRIAIRAKGYEFELLRSVVLEKGLLDCNNIERFDLLSLDTIRFMLIQLKVNTRKMGRGMTWVLVTFNNF